MKTKIPVIFFGTHEFAKSILVDLLESGLYTVELVVTQPDQPVGRKKIMTPPPVKIFAEKNTIPVLQPETLKNFIFQNKKSSLGIVAQYGKIIPKSVLDQFELGLINTHTSLLPKYRGASPIQSALMNGETETGVTLMLLDEGMDTGPILAQKSVQILPDETYLDLDKRLATGASELLLITVEKYIQGEIQPKVQEETNATSCELLSRDNGRIDWENMTSEEIYNQYRGLTPWPGIWSTLDGKRIKFLSVKKGEKNIQPGKFVQEKDSLFIGCKSGSLQILELQLEGKPPMKAEAFINGYKQLLEKTLE